MTAVITALLILSILPLACAWITAYFKKQQLGSVDNNEPREQTAQLTGAGARAAAAQSNSWEALILFSATTLAVSLSGVALASIANLAIIYTALRVIYIPLYIGNIAALRSLTYISGFGICMYMFYLALSN